MRRRGCTPETKKVAQQVLWRNRHEKSSFPYDGSRHDHGSGACGSTASTDTAASAADTASSTEAAASTADSTAAADGKVYNIGICQLVQHEALDAATQGFKDALVEKLGEGSVKFDEQNASGDSANCATIVNGFVSNGVD